MHGYVPCLRRSIRRRDCARPEGKTASPIANGSEGRSPVVLELNIKAKEIYLLTVFVIANN